MPITKTKRGYKIANTLGYSKTRKQAEERLRAIKANQSKKRGNA
jgi:hypothetical protein